MDKFDIEEFAKHILNFEPPPFIKGMMKVMEGYDNSIKVIIIDIAMPHVFTKQQFETMFHCIKLHQKQILIKFGWISLAEKFLCKNMIETYERINKQGKDFVRYTAIRR